MQPTSATVDVEGMRTRGIFFVLLGLTIAGVTTGELVVATAAHADQRDLAHARATAEQLAAPEGVVVSTECHGDGLIWCWLTPQSVASVTASISAQLGPAAGGPVCQHLLIGTAAAGHTVNECLLAVRYGHHGAFAFVSPLPTRDSHGQTRHADTLITVTAS